ncbi:MoaD/ThiS family protein [Pedobacter sp.]|uniref:MoaD/ThiS family protein n=1 Tax=Pedobacter sp. TaxID=1411316 RepID=UPI003D7FA67E
MQIEIISFGQIASFISKQQIDNAAITDTDALKTYLEKNYPQLQQLKYKLALNKDIVQENRTLTNNDVVALMPPFSGG